MDIGNMLEEIKSSATDTVKANEGDYFVNGLLYCCKCNTPKQSKIEVLGRKMTVPCLCKCEAERLALEEAERKRIETIDEIKRIRSVGFPDAEMRKWTFDVDDHANEKISSVARNYVENFSVMKKKGEGLLFYGTVGTGKTFISACIANALIDKGYPCLVTNFARLINTIQGMYEGKQAYIDGLGRFSLLVIDDLGAERNTEYMAETVQNIIDARYRSGKPIIVTTNLTPDELKHTDDVRKQRIYSRLYDMCIPVEVSGRDRRREKLKDKYGEYKKILGL